MSKKQNISAEDILKAISEQPELLEKVAELTKAKSKADKAEARKAKVAEAREQYGIVKIAVPKDKAKALFTWQESGGYAGTTLVSAGYFSYTDGAGIYARISGTADDGKVESYSFISYGRNMKQFNNRVTDKKLIAKCNELLRKHGVE